MTFLLVSGLIISGVLACGAWLTDRSVERKGKKRLLEDGPVTRWWVA